MHHALTTQHTTSHHDDTSAPSTACTTATPAPPHYSPTNAHARARAQATLSATTSPTTKPATPAPCAPTASTPPPRERLANQRSCAFSSECRFTPSWSYRSEDVATSSTHRPSPLRIKQKLKMPGSAALPAAAQRIQNHKCKTTHDSAYISPSHLALPSAPVAHGIILRP